MNEDPLKRELQRERPQSGNQVEVPVSAGETGDELFLARKTR